MGGFVNGCRYSLIFMWGTSMGSIQIKLQRCEVGFLGWVKNSSAVGFVECGNQFHHGLKNGYWISNASYTGGMHFHLRKVWQGIDPFDATGAGDVCLISVLLFIRPKQGCEGPGLMTARLNMQWSLPIDFYSVGTSFWRLVLKQFDDLLVKVWIIEFV